jgi:hypothetical protein
VTGVNSVYKLFSFLKVRIVATAATIATKSLEKRIVRNKRWKLLPNMEKMHIIATVITRRQERSLQIQN